MSEYQLPFTVARARLVSDERSDVGAGRLSKEARDRTDGRLMATLAIARALQERRTERFVRASRPRLLGEAATAAGYVLCERLAFIAEKAASRGLYDFEGLVLDRNDRSVYAYSAKLSLPLDSPRTSQMDAWGRNSEGLPYNNGDSATKCDVVEALDLHGDPLEVDRKIGAIAGALTLEDLLAGLAVRYRLTEQDIAISI